MTSPITIDVANVPLRTSLRLLLEQLGLVYKVGDGLLRITSATHDDLRSDADSSISGDFVGRDDRALAQSQTASGAVLNHVAASDQAEELK